MTLRKLTGTSAMKARTLPFGKKAALMMSTGALALVAAAPVLAQPALDALPTGGSIAPGNGAGVIQAPVNDHLQIDQYSERLVINWDSFDIGQNASVDFNQTAGDQSVAVNRVIGVGTDPSQIFGELTANGTVVIINGNGVVFGGTADVDVGRLVVTTSGLADADIMDGGSLSFSAPSSATGLIDIMAGANISVADAGLAAFVAPRVSNAGVITARGGQVTLASGVAYTLDLAGDGLIELEVGADSPLVTHAGQILAEGGLVRITAAAAAGLVDDVINVSGAIDVTSATLEDGVIVLSAGDANGAGGAVNVSADLTVDGDIEIEARRIHGAGDIDVTDGALNLALNVNGADVGGETLIQDALNVIGTTDGGTTLNLGSGTYAGGNIVTVNDLTIQGQDGVVVEVPRVTSSNPPFAEQGTGFTISGDNVAIDGVTIQGPVTQDWRTADWGVEALSWGIRVLNGSDNVALTNNTISDVRNGILIDGRNSGVVTGNVIDNTKSGISVQYTDAGLGNTEGFTLDISGNDDGVHGNEWGINFHLNGHYEGATYFNNSQKIAQQATADVQAALLAWSAANNGQTAQDQGYALSNRTHVQVATTGSAGAQGSLLSAISTVQGGIDAVVDGGFVSVADGTYNIGASRIIIGKSLTLAGQSEGGVIIDGRGVGGGLGTMLVSADDVSLSNFTLYGADSGVNNFGIKVQPDPVAYSTGQRLLNFSISDVTVQGSTRAELDLNGVKGATITDFTANGHRVGTTTETGGAGVQITDSQDVVLSGVTTMGNQWGSVAIYQTNRAGGYDQLTDNITVNAASSSFSEALGVFVQSYSTLHPEIGQLNMVGFDYVVRNDDHRAGGDQFTFFRTDLADATELALGLTNAGSSSIEGYTGTAYTNEFTVIDGLRIGAALRDARDGATITVGAGDYVENIAITQSDITLVSTDGRDDTTIQGVAGAGAGQTVLISGDGATLGDTDQGFTIVGFDNGNPGSEDAAVYIVGNNSGTTIRGNDIVAGGDVGLLSQWNMALTDLTVDGNIFSGTTYVGAAPAVGNQFSTPNVSRQLVAIGGGSGSTDVTFTNNQVTGDSGLNTGVTVDSSNATITGNTFASTTGGSLFRARGTNVTVSGNAFDTTGLSAAGAVLTLGTATAATNAAFEAYLAANGLDSDGAYAELTTGSTRDLYRSIQGAVNQSAAGGVVNILEGDYGGLVTINKALTLAGAGMDDTTLNDGLAISGSPTGLMLTGFTVQGAAGTSVVSNSGVLTDLTMDDVRIDGEGVAGRHGFIGGQIGGDISITNSEFVNIRGWAAFDTRSGAGGVNDGSTVTSAVFSGNLIDNTVGHIAFRQLSGGAYADVEISDNTVSNIGDTTNSLGGVFKAFNAGMVDFTGNTISDIGVNASLTSDGVAYGAALLVRGVDQLTVTDNSFTNVHMAVATEKASGTGVRFAAPNSTTFSGNSFDNVGYGFFMPVDALSTGALTFGAGNSFTSGADTVQHLVWRGAGAVDMAGVSFDGELASEMTQAELFALEDRIFHGVDASGAGFVTVKNGHLFVTEGSGANAIIRAVLASGDGDTVNLADGDHVVTSTINIDESISLVGQSRDGTVIDGTAIAGYGMEVNADGVTLSGFTFQGDNTSTASGEYGIKVQPGTNAIDDRVHDFAISNVAIQGFGGSELDLNGVIGATIDNVIADGQGTKGVGVAITDSADVTLTGVVTTDNLWGSVALYQTNRWYDQQTTGINIDAGENSFSEFLGVFAQSYSDMDIELGELNLTGFGHVVANAAHRANGDQFTFFRTTLGDAIDFAVNLNPSASDSSVVGGWSGSDFDGNFYVGVGELIGGGTRAMSISAAVDSAQGGETVWVQAGDYTLTSTLNVDETLNLIGAGQGVTRIDASGVSGYGVHVTADQVYLTDFTLTGPSADAGSSYGIKVNPVGGRAAVLDTFWITDVTIQGSGRAELDLNGVMNATIDGVTADGLGGKGAGIAIADSDNVVIRNSVTRDNAWGGVALYSANLHFDQQLANITIEADNDFQEANGLYLQHYSTIHDGPENISIAGYGFAVQNDVFRAAEGDWVYFQKTRQDAMDFAVNLGDADASVVRGWAGDDFGADFHVGFGDLAGGGQAALSIQTAFDASGAGDTIHIDDGDYGQSATLAGVRDILFGDVALTTLTLTSGAAGSGLSGSVTATGDIGVAGNVVLLDDLSLTGAAISMAGVNGSAANGQSLTLDGQSVSLGSAGSTVGLDGLTVSGAATLTGSGYVARAVSMSGVTLASDVSIEAGSVALGAVNGGHGLTIDADGVVALGEVGESTALTSLDVTGDSIITYGATTTGAQSYVGELSLAGDYAASSFSAVGGATLEDNTAVTATGAIVLGAVDGQTAGGQSLVLDGGSVSLGSAGATNALASLLVFGPATLTGTDYIAGGVALNDAVTLTDDATIEADGAVALGSVDGAHALSVQANSASLGAVGSTTALTSLTVAADTIATAGAATTGAQTYDGALTLDGAYTASGFNAAQGATIAGDTSVAATGAVVLGDVSGAAGDETFAVSGDAIVLGDATNLGSLSTSGVTTLDGSTYAAGAVSMTGALTLTQDTAVSADGAVTLGSVDGAHALTVDGASASLGAVGSTTALASLDVTADAIATNGAATTGGQTYSGAVSFAGDYITGAGDFTVSGASTLSGATSITTEDGDVVLGSVDGSTAGGQALSIDAGDGSATLGVFGAGVRLGAVLVEAQTTVLNGSTYAGNSLAFLGGGATATVRLTQDLTTFDTTQSASAAGDITIQPDLIGTTAGEQGVAFIAGSGAAPASANGDVTIGNAGADDLRLAGMTVSGDDFSAQTVKLADDFGSVLSGNQTFSANTLDTLGDVNAQVAGSESGPIIAGGDVFIVAGGSATGNLTAGGAVNVVYGTGSNRVIDAGGPVTIATDSGDIGGSIQSGGAVTVNSGGGVNAPIAAGGPVIVTAENGVTGTISAPGSVQVDAGGAVDLVVNAGSVTVNAPGGVITGQFDDITTGDGGTFIVNGETIISLDARQFLIDGFIVPAGGVVGSTGLIQLPVGLAIGLIAPAGEGEGQRRAIIVNDIDRLGELLRQGYTAIVVQIDEGDEPAFEQELDIAQTGAAPNA